MLGYGEGVERDMNLYGIIKNALGNIRWNRNFIYFKYIQNIFEEDLVV